jgi:hypothetical protein
VVTYPGTADQIRVVRADLRALLDDCPMADDVLVCASELATPWPTTGLIEGDHDGRTVWARFDWPGP